MAERKIIHDDEDPAQNVDPDLSNHVSTVAELIAALRLASLKSKPARRFPLTLLPPICAGSFTARRDPRYPYRREGLSAHRYAWITMIDELPLVFSSEKTCFA